MEYTYFSTDVNNQYFEDYDLTQNAPVQARYVKSRIDDDNGNRFIEALPRPRLGNEVMNDYNRSLYGFSREKQAKLNNYEKIASVSLLRKVRFVLPFHAELEEYFNMALLVSYRERQLVISPFSNYTVVENNNEYKRNAMMYGSNTSAANAGVTVLGYSGCGKSASLEILLSNYPQRIEHTLENGNKFTQIVYLSVVCTPNSNFSALYQSIGAEIDRILGNLEPFYEERIAKARTLGAKADIVCRLINVFGIGCIIFDEIQLINFDSNKENSFEGLLTIVNKTKVALMTVGTEDAYGKMFPNLRTARRTGNLVNAKAYCDNKKYFEMIVKGLFKYQWFDDQVSPTKSIVNALYDVTKGIIDQLIGVYAYMQIDYIRAKNKPTVDADYVYKVANKNYPGMQKILNDINNPFVEQERRRLLEEAEMKLQSITEEARQQAETEKLMKQMDSASQEDIQNIKDNVVVNINNALAVTGEKYNAVTIEKAIDFAIKKLGVDNLNETAVSSVAYKWLMKQNSDARKPKKRAKSGEKADLILLELEENM